MIIKTEKAKRSAEIKLLKNTKDSAKKGLRNSRNGLQV